MLGLRELGLVEVLKWDISSSSTAHSASNAGLSFCALFLLGVSTDTALPLPFSLAVSLAFVGGVSSEIDSYCGEGRFPVVATSAFLALPLPLSLCPGWFLVAMPAMSFESASNGLSWTGQVSGVAASVVSPGASPPALPLEPSSGPEWWPDMSFFFSFLFNMDSTAVVSTGSVLTGTGLVGASVPGKNVFTIAEPNFDHNDRSSADLLDIRLCLTRSPAAPLPSDKIDIALSSGAREASVRKYWYTFL